MSHESTTPHRSPTRAPTSAAARRTCRRTPPIIVALAVLAAAAAVLLLSLPHAADAAAPNDDDVHRKQVDKVHKVHRDESLILEDAANVGHEAVDTLRDAGYLVRDTIEVSAEKARTAGRAAKHAKDKLGEVAGEAKEVLGDAYDKTKAGAAMTGETAKHVIDVTTEKAQHLAHNVGDFAKGAKKRVVRAKDTVESAAQSASKRAKILGEDVREAAERAKEKAGKKAQSTGSWFSRMWNWLTGTTRRAKSRLVDEPAAKARRGAEQLHDRAKARWEKTKDEAEDTWEDIKDSVGHKGRVVRDKLQETKEAGQRKVRELTGKAKDAAEEVEDEGEEGWESFKTQLSELQSSLENRLRSAQDHRDVDATLEKLKQETRALFDKAYERGRQHERSRHGGDAEDEGEDDEGGEHADEGDAGDEDEEESEAGERRSKKQGIVSWLLEEFALLTTFVGALMLLGLGAMQLGWIQSPFVKERIVHTTVSGTVRPRRPSKSREMQFEGEETIVEPERMMRRGRGGKNTDDEASNVEDIDTALEHQHEKFAKAHYTPTRARHLAGGGRELRSQ